MPAIWTLFPPVVLTATTGAPHICCKIIRLKSETQREMGGFVQTKGEYIYIYICSRIRVS